MIYFEDLTHTYYNEKKEIYKSVSGIIDLYFPKFEDDKDFWLYYKSLQDVLGIENDEAGKKQYGALLRSFSFFKLKDKNKDQLVQIKNILLGEDCFIDVDKKNNEWKETNIKATTRGSAFHSNMESKFYNEGHTNKEVVSVTTHKEEVKQGLVKAYPLLGTTFGMNGKESKPELVVYNDKYKICGTMDNPIFEYPYVDIDDFKGFSLDTLIPTVGGFIKMEDIKVGDIVYDGAGKETKVKNISKIHFNKCFKLIMDDNNEFICDDEHLWEVGYFKRGKYIKQVLTTEFIFNNYKKFKYNIECLGITNEEDIDLPLDPYVLGLWLADGNRTCGSITCINQDIWDELKRRGFELSVDHNRNNEKAESRTILGISSKLRELNLISNKHLPLIYLSASYNQRLDLLRGLLDGDGYYNKIRKRCVVTTTRKWQKDLVTQLVSSLGWRVTSFNYKTKGFGKENIPAFSVNFTPKENPFLCRNKDMMDDLNLEKLKRINLRYIKEIVEIPTVATKCIEVESELHTYLVGESYLKTHNTNGKLEFSNKYQKAKAPIAHLDSCNGSKYRIQLSLYAWMLEQYGYKPRNLTITHVIFLDDKPQYTVEHKVEYLKKEVENILEHYASTYLKING